MGIEEGDHNHGALLVDLDLLALPPRHVVGLGEEVVAVPPGDGDHGDLLVDESRGPADLLEHAVHLGGDLGVASLGVGTVSTVLSVHLVDAHDELLDAEKVDETSVLTGLALDLTGLVVALLDSGNEVTVGGHHEHTNISLGGTGDHVLDEVTVTGGIDHGVVPMVGEELLRGAGDGHAALALLLLPVHEKGEGERALAETVSLILQLLQLTLRQ